MELRVQCISKEQHIIMAENFPISYYNNYFCSFSIGSKTEPEK